MELKGFESFISCTVHFDIKKYLSWDFVVGGCEYNVICSDLFAFIFYWAVILCFLIILMDFIVLDEGLAHNLT